MGRVSGANPPAQVTGKTALDARRQAQRAPGKCARVGLAAKAAPKNLNEQRQRGTPKVLPGKFFAIRAAGEITDHCAVRLGDIGPIGQLFFIGLDPYSSKKPPTLRRDRRAIIAGAATKLANRIPNSSLGLTIHRKASYRDWSQPSSLAGSQLLQPLIMLSRPTHRALRRCAQLDIGQALK